MIFNLIYGGEGGGAPSTGPIAESDISFSGSYLFASDGDDWELAITAASNTTLRFTKDPGPCDVFILDAGEAGEAGHIDWTRYRVCGGKGGSGGKRKTHSNITLNSGVDYKVTVGTNGGASSLTRGDALNLTATGGKRSAGGRGADMPYNIVQTGTVPTGGTDGIWAFEEDADSTLIPALKGKLLGPGGGGGEGNNRQYVYTVNHGGIDVGGETGGGKGANGINGDYTGHDASGYGAGGGGGYCNGSNDTGYAGGVGSSGLIMIRNHK